MGYTTDFDGQLSIDPPLNKAQVAYLNAFSENRRMSRDETKAAAKPDPRREAVGLSIGKDGGYFVGGGGYHGQDTDDSVNGDTNRPPEGQPGPWCQWVVTEEGDALLWDEGEKFYEYDHWLVYLVEHFFEPWGKKLNGQIKWKGEESDDIGTLFVQDNKLEAVYSHVANPGPSWDTDKP